MFRMKLMAVWGLIGVMLILIPLAAQAADQARQTDMVWKLMNGRVIESGRRTNTGQGEMISGYVIEADAYDREGARKEGVFRVELSSFQPTENLPGQVAGNYYVRGSWSISKELPEESNVSRRRDRNAIGGHLEADLTFDPTVSNGDLQATLNVPTSLSLGGWLKAVGTFSGDRLFNGDLTLAVTRLAKEAAKP